MDLGRLQAEWNVSRETAERLEVFARLLGTWTRKINLVAPKDRNDLWGRHILDSLQLLDLAPTSGDWLDLGSGGGLPGIVVAIASPGHRVTLVESDQRKATFLRTALRATGTSGQVLSERVESLQPRAANIVSARAFAPLPRLLDLAGPHLAEGACLLAPKGRRYRQEVQEALATHSFTCETHQSRTDEDAVILFLREITRV